MRSIGWHVAGANDVRLDRKSAKQSTDKIVWRQLLTMAYAAAFLTDLADVAAQSQALPASQVPTTLASASLHSAQPIEEHLQASQSIHHECLCG